MYVTYSDLFQFAGLIFTILSFSVISIATVYNTLNKKK